MQIVADSLLNKTTNIVWGRTICKLLCTLLNYANESL